jgi:mutator protein MutT
MTARDAKISPLSYTNQGIVTLFSIIITRLPMTYFQHLKKELCRMRFFIPSIIMIYAIPLYYRDPSHFFSVVPWLQYALGLIIVFPITSYLQYKYDQMTRDPFKERLSNAIRIKPKKVIAALIYQDDKILIAQRGKKDAFYGKWEFPGGKLEAGETEQECLARELFEELGVRAKIGSYFCSSLFEHKGDVWEMRAYFVTSFTGEIQLHEHQEVQWVRIEELSGYDMPNPDKPIVEKLLKQVNR